jgi:hypothetical protein
MYDIFKKMPGNSPIWVEAVEGLEQVRKRLGQLPSALPGEYLVYDPASQKFIEPFDEST